VVGSREEGGTEAHKTGVNGTDLTTTRCYGIPTKGGLLPPTKSKRSALFGHGRHLNTFCRSLKRVHIEFVFNTNKIVQC